VFYLLTGRKLNPMAHSKKSVTFVAGMETHVINIYVVSGNVSVSPVLTLASTSRIRSFWNKLFFFPGFKDFNTSASVSL
jgi:hypothetical protein